VLFGDEQATERMEKLVVNAQADPSIRRRTLKILIDSDSTNLKVLCGKLLNDPEMQVLAVRGLTNLKI
jgi:hypothetical protein